VRWTTGRAANRDAATTPSMTWFTHRFEGRIARRAAGPGGGGASGDGAVAVGAHAMSRAHWNAMLHPVRSARAGAVPSWTSLI
jgi:hypothetical protein